MELQRACIHAQTMIWRQLLHRPLELRCGKLQALHPTSVCLVYGDYAGAAIALVLARRLTLVYAPRLVLQLGIVVRRPHRSDVRHCGRIFRHFRPFGLQNTVAYFAFSQIELKIKRVAILIDGIGNGRPSARRAGLALSLLMMVASSRTRLYCAGLMISDG